jgi:hypothetical protein
VKFLIHIVNALSAFVPDFLLLSLIGAEFISLYSVAKACGLIPRTNLKLGTEIALALAYLVAIAIDIVNELLQPARSSVGVPTRRAVHNPSGFLPRKRHYKSPEERVLVTRP